MNTSPDLRPRTLSGQRVAGTFLNPGSPLATDGLRASATAKKSAPLPPPGRA